jgi:hypothetical protein
MKEVYEVMNNNDVSILKKIEIFKTASDFISSTGNGLSSNSASKDLKDALFLTYRSLLKLQSCDFDSISNEAPIPAYSIQRTKQMLEIQKKIRDEDFRISTCSTLLVEHHFGRIRAQVRYPCAWEYMWAYNHALEELHKQHHIEQPFPLRKCSPTKAYPSNTNLLISTELPTWTKASRKEAIQKCYNENHLSEGIR